ncbi:TonB-dependent receptor plug domain-containing protein [Veillonella intestinalis]|uniref:TonB-dependent receptor plug domain-containing protein n=1 Tax=Veillonella intestinalis TaxID=2941341 RepID=UPI00203BBAFD|nr:TonB-dependent receptor [Veillonella intestinalis]
MKFTHRSTVSKAVLTALVVSATSGSVWAANYDEANLQDLGKVVLVTASRLSEEKVDVPADTTVITAKEIEQGNYNQVSDALKANNVPVIQKGFAAYPELNGDTRVLVMVNGRKMNWDHLVVSGASNAIDIDQIPMDNIERIEVVKGPNSALYGERAVAGVINIITKTPTMGQQTTVRGELGSWGHRKGTIITQGGDEKNGYFVSYTKERRDNIDYKDYRGNTHEFPDTYINRDKWTARYDRYIGDDLLSLDFSRIEKKDGYGIRLKNPLLGTVTGAGNVKETTDMSYGVTYNFGSDSGTFIRAYRNTEVSDSGFGSGSTSSSYSHDLSMDGIEGQKTWQLGNHTLISGVTYNQEHIKEENNGVAFDRSMISKAVYVEDKWELGRGWTANFGTRYEHQDMFGGDFASHIGLNKKLNDNTHAYISWGQAVNNPTLKMLYAATEFWRGNPDLEQEKSQTVTLGIDSDVTDRLTVSASVFNSRLKNALSWVNGSYGPNNTYIPGYYENVNREKRQGLNLSATYRLDEAWKVRAGYSYLKVRQDTGSGYVNATDNRNPNRYSLEFFYEKNRWSVNNLFQYVTGRSETQFSDSSYFVWDVNVNYKINEATKVYAQAFNLTNEAYEVEPSTTIGSYAMPGRHYVVGVEHTF